MSEHPESPATPGTDQPAAGPGSPVSGVVPEPVVGVMPVPEPPAWTPPAPPQDSSGVSAAAAVATDRPEVAVGAAFAGGLVLALILKRLAR